VIMAKGKSGFVETAQVVYHYDVDEARFHWLTNNSGGALSTGAVVVWDTSADDAFTTTTTEGDLGVCGVVAAPREAATQTIADGDQGWIRYNGLCPKVQVDSVANRGDWLITSSTAGKAHPVSGAVAPPGAFGLVTVGGTTECQAWIFPCRDAQLHPTAQVGTTSISYDGQGRVSEITTHIAGNNYHKRTFAYSGDLLAKVTEEYPTGNTILTWTVSRDTQDRITSATRS